MVGCPAQVTAGSRPDFAATYRGMIDMIILSYQIMGATMLNAFEVETNFDGHECPQTLHAQ